MIATLTGIIAEKLDEIVVLDVGGVGYGLLVNNEDFAALAKGEDAKLYVYEQIRESSYDLFGFTQLNTKELFEQLIGVNGVGPRMGLSILNVGNSDEVKKAIASGDVRFIQQASGVGKRLAERVIVELKDKLGLPGADLESTGILTSDSIASDDDAVLALVSLGYTAYDAALALKKVDTHLPTEERIKLALQGNHK